ncbi:MAG: NAD kinase [Alphaproteobacteria bacterium]|nr:NAD kinase [Alphaproteobacteria bacterium]
MKIHFVYSSNAKSRNAYEAMMEIYGQCPIYEADCVVVLSGDGMILRAFHENYQHNLPIYGMNRGELGFLTNKYQKEDLVQRIKKAVPLKFHPLRALVEKENGKMYSAVAVNEVYLLRETHQSAKLQVKIDGVVRLEELVCDGLITSSALGSTAYNYSAGGPIIPSGAALMTLTPISSFRPRCWRGALLPAETCVELKVLHPDSRPVCAVADYVEFRNAVSVKIVRDKSLTFSLLLDPDNTLEKKILEEQFAT